MGRLFLSAVKIYKELLMAINGNIEIKKKWEEVSTMRYSSLRSLDVSNGEDVGISLFISGCRARCAGCHNPEQWSFSAGEEFTWETQNEILQLLDKDYIHRASILGGEPLEPENLFKLACLCNKIKIKYPDKKIWLYTGYTWEELQERAKDELYVWSILRNIDILVDGRFIESEKDISLKFKGSRNQRIIDVPQSIKKHKIVIYEV